MSIRSRLVRRYGGTTHGTGRGSVGLAFVATTGSKLRKE